MGVTAFSFFLLPLCALWIMSPDKLLQLLLVAAVFEAAAALTIGSLGLQPGLVPALAFLGFVGLQVLLGARYPGEGQVLVLTRPFVLVTFWALASSFLMPRFFAGVAYVWPQKATPPFVLTPLAPSPSNVNQDIYLIINCALLLATALYLTRSNLSLRPFIRAYLYSGFLAAGIAAWQFANKVAGIPYPEALFYSNPGWALLTTQQIGNMPRINGSFSEPSSLAGYMASIVCASGWLLLQGHRDRLVRWLFLIGLLAIALSTSTTGFATLALMAAAVTVFALVTGSTRLMAGIIRIGVPLVLLLGVLSAGASVFVPQFNRTVAEVTDATLNKQQSSSYNDRTGADLDSLKAMLDTDGLGVGWGSNRSSSLAPGLLAGIGIPGCLGLLWFAIGLTQRVRRARRQGASSDQLLVIDACCGALAGFILTAAIAAPTITSVTFFVLLALLIACVVRVDIDARNGFAERQRAALTQSEVDFPTQ